MIADFECINTQCENESITIRRFVVPSETALQMCNVCYQNMVMVEEIDDDIPRMEYR